MPATATEEQIAKYTLRAGDTIFTKDSGIADDIAIATYIPKDVSDILCGHHLSIVRQACSGISVESELKVRFLCDFRTATYLYIRDDVMKRAK